MLPRVNNSSRASAVRTVRTPIAKRARPVILIAEDNADSLEMMQLLLESKGYAVLRATDGPEAVASAIENQPDLILIDLQLPRLDGLAVARSLHNRHDLKSVPIVILSGHDPRQYRQAALDAGCSDYLLKPIDFDRIDELLDRILLKAVYDRLQ